MAREVVNVDQQPLPGLLTAAFGCILKASSNKSASHLSISLSLPCRVNSALQCNSCISLNPTKVVVHSCSPPFLSRSLSHYNHVDGQETTSGGRGCSINLSNLDHGLSLITQSRARYYRSFQAYLPLLAGIPGFRRPHFDGRH